MKKTFLFLALAAMIFTACNNCDCIIPSAENPQSPTCKFTNPLNDLDWLSAIYTNLSVKNNQHTSISQVNYSGGIGFFIDYGMAFDVPCVFYDCAGNGLCSTGRMGNTCTDLNIDFENKIVLWQGGNLCNALNNQSITATEYLINQFFDKQATTVHPANVPFTDVQKMQEFVAWLNGFDCIVNAEILCVSGIYTLPAQSEVSITFYKDGQTITKVMDISMSDIPRFAGFHND